jgi:futalosine hydrolase
LKSIGIIASTYLEAEILIRRMTEPEDSIIQGKLFCRGLFQKRLPVIVCICGIGKSNAAHGTTLLIDRFHPDMVYSIGVAGAFPESGLHIGDIAVAGREIYADEGVALSHCFNSMETLKLPLASVDGIDYYNEFPLTIPDQLKDYSPKGTFVTVSSCTGTLAQGKELGARYNAICENMEGAAVAHICMLNRIPAAELRGISNIINDRTGLPLERSTLILSAESVQRFFLDRCLDQD